MTSIIRACGIASVAMTLAAGALAAQRAITVSGHVSSRGVPLRGAHVRLPALDIDRTTDERGRYSFLIPPRDVRGQMVEMTATMSDRYTRYVSASAAVQLTGEAIVQDFDLAVAREEPRRATVAVATRPTDASASALALAAAAASSGATNPFAGLAGRLPGVSVSSSAVPGGSTQILVRGPRSVLGSNEPLVVLDGLPMSHVVFTSPAQRFGLGGFDYGDPVADLDPATVASIRVLRGAEAATYGARGANGVIAMTTRSAADGPHFGVTARQHLTTESVLRLPKLQNLYGQGLDGEFEFFDGRGGGINDDVDENWGPPLDGRPLPQASHLEAGRPDVRLWTARPDNVRRYFGRGTTASTTVSLQGRNDLGSFLATAGRETSTGITPGRRLERRRGTLGVTVRPSQRIDLSLHGFGAQAENNNAPGSGYGDGNPAFQFARLGRQVDMDSLEHRLRDASGSQITWIYSGHDNPFFQTGAGANYSRRYHLGGSGTATVSLTPWLTATARGGADYYRDGRLVTVPSGWLGGFPFLAGAGDFSRGGSQGDEIAVQQTDVAFQLSAARTLSGGARWTAAAGIDRLSARQRARSAGVDSATNFPDPASPDSGRVPPPVTWFGYSNTTSLFGEMGMAFTNGASLQAALRNERVAITPPGSVSLMLPSIRGALDLARAIPAMRTSGLVSSAVLHGAWWADASEVTPYSLATMYAGRTPAGMVAPADSGLLATAANLTPETTHGVEFGADVALRPLGLSVGLTLYRERSLDVILPLAPSPSGPLAATNAASITNTGLEARMSAQVGDGVRGLGWTVAANAARTSNRVDHLAGSENSVALGPSLFGLTVAARTGEPLGVLIGERLLRDPTSNALMLRDGLPVADTAAGAQRLGVGQPTWLLGVGNTVRYRWFTASVLFDARVGGQVFSATNLVGNSSGTFATTAFRPDSGLLISGIDAATGSPNTQHVSTQAYFHALGAVAEPWVYSATFMKLREARLTLELPTLLRTLPFQSVHASLVGRNLHLWSRVPNVDPETVFSPYQLRGVEMGQLPTTRSFGVEVTIVP